jgi:hypothetical protein
LLLLLLLLLPLFFLGSRLLRLVPSQGLVLPLLLVHVHLPKSGPSTRLSVTALEAPEAHNA